MAQANADIKFYAYISGEWVQLQDTGGADEISGFWGMIDNNPITRVANTGYINLYLKNDTGIYTPGGPNALAGWKKGIPVKMVVSFEGCVRNFRYYLSGIQIGMINKNPKCYISLVDWMDYAARHPIVNPGIQTNKRGDEVLETLKGLIEIDPLATEFDTGTEVFPTVYDTVTSKTKAYSEFTKVALSEIGYVYLKKDKTNGETLVFESSEARHGWRAPDEIEKPKETSGFLLKEDGGFLLKEDGGKIYLNEAAPVAFDDSIITDFDAPYGENIINRLTVYANPRRLSSAPEILFKLDKEIVIGAGKTVTIKGTYANPSGGLPINAQDMITPVATTDYLVYKGSGGTGTNITASLALTSVEYGTEGFTIAVTNNNAARGYITKFNCRGTGIYIYNPIEHAASNSESIDEFEDQSYTLNQKYKNDLYAGRIFAESKVDENKQPLISLNSISFIANKSGQCMMSFLNTDVGTVHFISIPEAGISGNYYVQGIEFRTLGGIIVVKWIVILALSLQVGCGLSQIAVEYTGDSTDAVDFGYLPQVTNLPLRSDSGWIYLTAWPTSASSTISGNGGFQYMVGYDSHSIIFYQVEGEAGPVSQWKTANNVIELNTLYHVVVTRDSSIYSNVPKIYINGVEKAITEVSPPTYTPVDQTGDPFLVGNTYDYSFSFSGKLKDVRVYNRILSAGEVTTLYNSGVPDASLVTDGLVFQAFAVRTTDLSTYIDQTLTSTLRLRDNVFGAIGVPHGTPVGRSAE